MFLATIVMLIVVSPLIIPVAVHVCHALQTALQNAVPAGKWTLAGRALAPAA